VQAQKSGIALFAGEAEGRIDEFSGTPIKRG